MNDVRAYRVSYPDHPERWSPTWLCDDCAAQRPDARPLQPNATPTPRTCAGCGLTVTTPPESA